MLKLKDSKEAHISIWRYLAATATPVLLLSLSMYFLVDNLRDQREFTENQLKGVATIEILHESMVALQRIRGLLEVHASGNSLITDELSALQEQFEQPFSRLQWPKMAKHFGILNEMDQLQRKEKELFFKTLNTSRNIVYFERYSILIDEIRRYIRLVADRSNLTQDSELASNFIVDLIVIHIPEVIEFAGKIAGLGSGMIASGQTSYEGTERLKESLIGLQFALTNMNNRRQTIQASAPELKELLHTTTQDADRAVESFIQATKDLLSGSASHSLEHYINQGTSVIEAYNRPHQQLVDLLTARLTARYENLSSLMFYTVLGTSLAVLLMVYFTGSFYRRNLAAFRKIEQISITDSLTGLWNRRYMQLIMSQELRRIHRENRSLTFAMLDIDNFKRYNDTYGHQAGDEVIRQVAATMKSCLQRATDFLFRIGGEEFCFFFGGGTPSLMAPATAEAIIQTA